MGEAVGTGGKNFTNVVHSEVTDSEIAAFDTLRFVIDWGYAVDPFCFVVIAYDKTRRRIVIFDEIFAVGMSNRDAASHIKDIYSKARITADSAEPKSIDELSSQVYQYAEQKKAQGQ